MGGNAPMRSTAPPRGTIDYSPSHIAWRNNCINNLKNAVESICFIPAETPLLEHQELFTTTLGQDSDIITKELFKVQDSKHKIVLRPEGTAPIIRSLVHNQHLYDSDPLCPSGAYKLWYSGPMFRRERPQKGRSRQFYQFGTEFIQKTPETKSSSFGADIMSLFSSIIALNALKIDSMCHINSLGSFDQRREYTKSLSEYYINHHSLLSKESQQRLSNNSVFRILDSKIPQDIEINQKSPKMIEFIGETTKTQLDVFVEIFQRFMSSLASSSGQTPTIQINSNLVRGLDYYTGTVFEFISDSPSLGQSQATICAGGRYDGIFEKYNQKSPRQASGWAMGLERLSLIQQDNTTDIPNSTFSSDIPKRDALVLIGEGPNNTKLSIEQVVMGLRFASMGRKHNSNQLLLPCFEKMEIDGSDGSIYCPKLNSQLRSISDQAENVYILGPQEIADGTILVKDMSTGKQHTKVF